MAYFLLYRHARLVLDYLSKHPQARNPKYETALINARKAVKNDLVKLESLKPAINQRHEKYMASLQARASARPSQPQVGLTRERDWQEGGQLEDYNENLTSRRQEAIDPLQHPDLAVKFANLEVQRRLQKTRPFTIATEDDINARLRELRKQIDRASESKQSFSTRPLHAASYSYPQVPGQHVLDNNNSVSRTDRTPQGQSTTGPRLPPKGLPPAISGPPLPAKEKLLSAQLGTSITTGNNHQFSTTALLESGSKLRTMFLPLTLRHRFLQIAEHNTRQKLETLGILTGTLIQNALFITKLVVPEQVSTSDTCEMVDELALYEWTTTQPEDLMVLGWIHTHPTQTCFLSSRDLHTHFPFQATLAESVAIVCSPSHQPDYGVYRLTDPPGLQAIKACRQSATFHPHEQTHIFTDALGRPGHVIEHSDLHFEVIDLRPKK